MLKLQQRIISMPVEGNISMITFAGLNQYCYWFPFLIGTVDICRQWLDSCPLWGICSLLNVNVSEFASEFHEAPNIGKSEIQRLKIFFVGGALCVDLHVALHSQCDTWAEASICLWLNANTAMCLSVGGTELAIDEVTIKQCIHKDSDGMHDECNLIC